MAAARAGAPPSSIAQMTKSASAPSLEALGMGQRKMQTLENSMDFTKFNVRDREFLKSFAHRRSRKTLRELSYPNLPSSSGRRTRAQQTGDSLVKPKLDEQQKSAAVAITLSPLQFALGEGPEAEAAQRFILEAKGPLAMDSTTAICMESSSLDWLDQEGLSMEMAEMAEDALSNFVPAPAAAPRASAVEAASVPPGDVIAATGIFGPSVKSLRAQKRPALTAVRWPSEYKFEEFYETPEEYQPPPMSPEVKEDRPLPSARKTISCLEESTNPGVQSFIYWQCASEKEQETSVKGGPWSGKAVGMFEASAMYREACLQLGVTAEEMIVPRPIFGNSVEVASEVVVGTRQCYAVAEAVRACMPRRTIFMNTVMTDMGAARIAESAVNSGRLEHLSITGTCLSYRFCTALYNCMRTRAGNTLTEIVLRGCGLGNNLDVDLRDLPALVASTYSKAVAALPEGIIAPACEDCDLTAEALAEENEFGKEVPTAEDEKKEEEDHRSQSKIAMRRGKRKQEEESILDEEGSPEGGVLDEPKTSWWDEEVAPLRSIPIALPLIIHIGRPGSGIQRLDLSSTDFTLEMARCVGWALSVSQMESLKLDRCCLDDAGLTALTDGLSQNNLLMELSLRGNNLSGAAEPVSELIHIVGRHASLAHWDFADNPIHHNCITELLSLMRYSCSVLCMHILGSSVSGEEARSVALECRAWVEEHMRSDEVAASQGLDSREDPDEVDTFFEVAEEMILCRARHVAALNCWRITSPSLQHKKKPASDQGEAVTAPFSWMPSGCWICKKCTTVTFRWVCPDRGEGDQTGSTGARLFVRPSFAAFSRVELQRERTEGNKRVVFWGQVLMPPGTHSYIFESHSEAKGKMLLCARDQPSTELANVTSKDESSELLDICKEFGYGGRINVWPAVKESDFRIPEHLEGEDKQAEEADPWSEDPMRQKLLYECYQVDLPCLHLDEICHVDEEDEVKETVWEIYGHLYDTYAMYAGRSLWPLIRQVDVYSFFEDARLLDRGPMSYDGVDLAPNRANKQEPTQQSACEIDGVDAIQPLSTQDIQQMIVQTITRRKNTIRRDATWSQRRKQLVVQRTLEGAPITRPQFVEVLLRAACALRGREPSTSVALHKFTERILAGRIMQPPLAPFPRGLALKAGVVCDTLLSCRKCLKQAYERFGTNETSFQRLAQLLKLCDRSFTAKHVASIYALSRRPIKYASTEQTSNLNYDEFSEAVARLGLLWQPSVGLAMISNPGAIRPCPPQPQVGMPVNQKAVAARLQAFFERLAERMKPSVVSRF